MNHRIRAALTAAIAVSMFALLVAAAGAQASANPPAPKQGGEKTVEEAYLQESAEAVIVKELAQSTDRDSKEIALDYAQKAVDAGHKSDDIRASLEYLVLENTDVIVRDAGLGIATNNFPDIRRRACQYLGEFPSVESKDTLVKVIGNSKVEDPMVLAEAIRSLGKIGMNDNDEVVHAICNSVNHFSHVGMSEDRLAVYTLFAFTDLADKNKGIKDMSSVTDTILEFTKGSYLPTVRKLAMQTLEKLASYAAASAN